jgi:hypothetical protein
MDRASSSPSCGLGAPPQAAAVSMMRVLDMAR